MRPRLLSALGLFALAACHPKPPPPKEPDEREVLRPKVQALSQQAEALLRDQDERIWKHWTEGAPVDIAKTYEGHESLFTPASIHAIDRLRQLSSDAREVRALGHLQAHFVGEFLAHELADQAEAIANLEASAAFSSAGKDYPYRELDHLLANEKDAAKRASFYAAATPAVERISALVRVKQDRADALVKSVGYPSYEAYGAQLREANLVELAALADQVLQVTQDPWEKVIDALAQRELQTPLAKLHRADLPRLFHSSGVDSFFPKDALVARARQTLAGIGIDLDHTPGLSLDARELAKKNRRPLAIAVRIPDDVRLSVRPAAGVHLAGSFQHELGHALHYAFCQERRFELSKLGDGSAYEAFARLWEDLLTDPVWLQEEAGFPQGRIAEYLAGVSAFRLYQLRLQAAHLLYEVQLHRADPTEVPALYKTIFSRALGFPLTAEEQARALVDQEDFYASADDLRAGFLAAQLQSQLKGRFGPSWWHSPDAGALLKALWAKGNAVPLEVLAKAMGEPALKADALLLRLGALLHTSMPLPSTLVPKAPAPDAGAPDAGPEKTSRPPPEDGGRPDSIPDAGAR